LTYKQAMRPKDGWARAEAESLIASASTILARYHAMNPEPIFEWAKKHCQNLYDLLLDNPRSLLPPDNRILTAVLNATDLDDGE